MFKKISLASAAILFSVIVLGYTPIYAEESNNMGVSPNPLYLSLSGGNFIGDFTVSAFSEATACITVPATVSIGGQTFNVAGRAITGDSWWSGSNAVCGSGNFSIKVSISVPGTVHPGSNSYHVTSNISGYSSVTQTIVVPNYSYNVIADVTVVNPHGQTGTTQYGYVGKSTLGGRGGGIRFVDDSVYTGNCMGCATGDPQPVFWTRSNVSGVAVGDIIFKSGTYYSKITQIYSSPLNPACYIANGSTAFGCTSQDPSTMVRITTADENGNDRHDFNDVYSIRRQVVTAVPAPTVMLTPIAQSIASGSAATLNWYSTGATYCSGLGSNPTTSTSGSWNTGILTASATYTITCHGPGGNTQSAPATVTVESPATLSVTASPINLTVVKGGSVQVSTLTAYKTNINMGVSFQFTNIPGINIEIPPDDENENTANTSFEVDVESSSPINPGTYTSRVTVSGTKTSNGSPVTPAPFVDINISVVAPDLIPDPISPASSTATVNVGKSFSAVVRNQGTGSTGGGFANTWRFVNNSDGFTRVYDNTSSTCSTIIAGANEKCTATISYPFPSVGNWSVLFCAGMSAASDNDNWVWTSPNVESNQGNNCTALATVMVTAPAATGNLNISPVTCTIASGASTCIVTATWDTKHATSPALVDRNTGTILSTLANRTVPFPVWATRPSTTFDLKNGSTTLDTVQVTPSCVSGTDWSPSVSKCMVPPATPADLTAGPISPTTVTAGVSTGFTSTITNSGGTSVQGGQNTSHFFQFTQNTSSGPYTNRISTTSDTISANGGTKNVSNTHTLTPAGNWYVRVCTDNNINGPSDDGSAGTVTESNEANNCTYPWTSVSVISTPVLPALPDLTASGISPTVATNGVATAFTTNVKSHDAASPDFFVRFQRASTCDVNQNCTEIINIGSREILDGLEDGEDRAVSYSYAFPYASTWYLRACADSVNSVKESDEDNNCGAWTGIAVTATPTPNLTAGAPTQTTAVISESKTFTSTIYNTGNASTGGIFRNTFQVATGADGSGTISSVATTPTSMPSLNAHNSNTASASYTFTAPAGTRSVRFCADSTNMINEGPNEGDNCSHPWTNLVVTFPLALPDLTATGITPAAATNGVATAFTTNVKSHDAASAPFTVRFQRASTCDVNQNCTEIINIGSTEVSGGLADGDDREVSYTYAFPYASTWYLRACADSVNSVKESDEDNNCGAWTAVSVTNIPYPDITASLVTPTTATIGASSTFSGTVTNLGNASTGSGTFNNIFQIDQNVDHNALYGVVQVPAGPLASGGSQEVSTTFVIPGPGENNKWYMRLCADNNTSGPTDNGSTGTVTELNENNNCSQTWTTITVSAAPEMTGDIALVTPCSIPLGQSSCQAEIYWEVSNPQTSNTVVTSSYPIAGTTVGTGDTGTDFVDIPYSSRSFFLYNNGEPPIDSLVVNANCQSGSWNGSVCASTPLLPNLIAEYISPTTTTAGAVTNFVTDVNNVGGASTLSSMTHTFWVINSFSQIIASEEVNTGSIGVDGQAQVGMDYVFPTAGTYSIRVCADNNSEWDDDVTESNEGDNCSSPWTPITVTNAYTLPTAFLDFDAETEANNNTIVIGDSATLYWGCSTNSTIYTGTNFSTSGLASGNVDVAPTETTNYTILCTRPQYTLGPLDPGGQDYEIVTLTVTSTDKKPIYKEN